MSKAKTKQAVRWVGQEDLNGCGIACIAMILQITYAEAKEFYRIFDGRGTSVRQMEEFLAAHGYYIRKIQSVTYLKGAEAKKRRSWPIKPFTDLQLCFVRPYDDTERFHFVIQLRDGTVLDPVTEKRRKLSYYDEVLWIAGIKKSDEF